MVKFLAFTIKALSGFMIGYTFAINTIYLLLIIISFIEIRAYIKYVKNCGYREITASKAVPPISILAPAYNEEQTIIDSINSFLQLKYPMFEVVVINDGSKDGTRQIIIDYYKMIPWKPVVPRKFETAKVIGAYISTTHPRLYLIDKANGGKADALNVGIEYSNFPYFTSLDADSLLDEYSLQEIVRPILENTEVVAVGGMVRVINGCLVRQGKVTKIKLSRKPIVIFQVVEYFRAFLAGRIGLNKLNSLLIISGAFGIFRKDIITQIGGYRRNCIGEDMELVIRMQRYIHENKLNNRIVYLPDPICWTQAPENIRSLKGQRNRWQRGLIQSLTIHKSLFANPRYGVLGMFTIPYYWLVEFMGPLFELSGYIFIILGLIFGFISINYLLLFTIVSILYGIFLSLLSLLLEDHTFHKYNNKYDYLLLSIFTVFENFGYHQLNTFWRVKALFDFLRKKHDWGTMERKAFQVPTR